MQPLWKRLIYWAIGIGLLAVLVAALYYLTMQLV